MFAVLVNLKVCERCLTLRGMARDGRHGIHEGAKAPKDAIFALYAFGVRASHDSSGAEPVVYSE